MKLEDKVGFTAASKEFWVQIQKSASKKKSDALADPGN